MLYRHVRLDYTAKLYGGHSDNSCVISMMPRVTTYCKYYLKVVLSPPSRSTCIDSSSSRYSFRSRLHFHLRCRSIVVAVAVGTVLVVAVDLPAIRVAASCTSAAAAFTELLLVTVHSTASIV